MATIVARLREARVSFASAEATGTVRKNAKTAPKAPKTKADPNIDLGDLGELDLDGIV